MEVELDAYVLVLAVLDVVTVELLVNVQERVLTVDEEVEDREVVRLSLEEVV